MSTDSLLEGKRYDLRVNHAVLPSTSYMDVHEQGKAIQYLVPWQGWPHEARKWVDSKDISDTLIE